MLSPNSPSFSAADRQYRKSVWVTGGNQRWCATYWWWALWPGASCSSLLRDGRGFYQFPFLSGEHLQRTFAVHPDFFEIHIQPPPPPPDSTLLWCSASLQALLFHRSQASATLSAASLPHIERRSSLTAHHKQSVPPRHPLQCFFSQGKKSACDVMRSIWLGRSRFAIQCL